MTERDHAIYMATPHLAEIQHMQACRDNGVLKWAKLWGCTFRPQEPQLSQYLTRHQGRQSHAKAAAEQQAQVLSFAAACGR